LGAKVQKENDLNKLIEDAFFRKSRDYFSRFYFSIKLIPFLIKFFLKTNISALPQPMFNFSQYFPPFASLDSLIVTVFC
jgi:hypothetical protein